MAGNAPTTDAKAPASQPQSAKRQAVHHDARPSINQTKTKQNISFLLRYSLCLLGLREKRPYQLDRAGVIGFNINQCAHFYFAHHQKPLVQPLNARGAREWIGAMEQALTTYEISTATVATDGMRPVFKRGDRILCSAEMRPERGDYVLFQFADNTPPLIAQLLCWKPGLAIAQQNHPARIFSIRSERIALTAVIETKAGTCP